MELEDRIKILEDRIKILEKIFFLSPKIRNENSEKRYRKIVEIICDYFGVTYEMINIKSRKRRVCNVRQVCHYFGLKYSKDIKYLDLSLSEIGIIAGELGHANVLYGKGVVINTLTYSAAMQQDIKNIDLLIRNNILTDKC